MQSSHICSMQKNDTHLALIVRKKAYECDEYSRYFLTSLIYVASLKIPMKFSLYFSLKKLHWKSERWGEILVCIKMHFKSSKHKSPLKLLFAMTKPLKYPFQFVTFVQSLAAYGISHVAQHSTLFPHSKAFTSTWKLCVNVERFLTPDYINSSLSCFSA